jgi:purine nucleosidase
MIKEEHAVNALIRISKEVKGLNIIAIGPLTNLALAFRMDPRLVERIDSLTIMGGSYKSQGNVTFNTEFNFRQDPEAASIVFKAGFKNLRLVPWETCKRACPSTPSQISLMYDDSTPLGVFHKETNNYWFIRIGHMLVDTWTAIINIDETTILGSFDAHAVIELAPGMSKGSL